MQSRRVTLALVMRQGRSLSSPFRAVQSPLHNLVRYA
jgi:hypothetical protein